MRLFILIACLLLASPAHAQPVHGAPIRALAVLPDWSVVSAGLDATIIVHRLSDGAATILQPAHDGAVNAIVALPDGGFASAGADGGVAIWSRTDTLPVRWLEGHTGPIAALAVNGEAIASASWDGTAWVWTGDTVRVLEGHTGPVNGVAFLSDGTPVTAGYDGTIRAWPEGTSRALARYAAPQNALIATVDGLASAGADGTLHLLSEDGRDRATVEAGIGPLVALASDGNRLAVAALSGTVLIIDTATAQAITAINTGETALWTLGFTDDGTTLITGGSARAPRRWDVATGRALGPIGTVPAPAAAQADRGAQLFRACAICHATGADSASRAGPSLAHLFGRAPASLPDYPYSDALRRLSAPWTRDSVAQLFEIGPQRFAPGTKMPEQRLADPDDRAALMDYLERATK